MGHAVGTVVMQADPRNSITEVQLMERVQQGGLDQMLPLQRG